QMASFNRPSFLTGHALADIGGDACFYVGPLVESYQGNFSTPYLSHEGATAPNSIHYAWRYNKMLSFLILQNFVSIRNTYCLLVEMITAWLSINQSIQIMTLKLPSPMGIKAMLKGVSKGAVYIAKRTLWCSVEACGSGRWPTTAAGGVVAAMAVVLSVGGDEGGVGGVSGGRGVEMRWYGVALLKRWRLVVMVVATLAASGDEDDEIKVTFDPAVYDYDWFFDEMKLVVELTFFSRNG
nr:hypothetical protein [Tanacetum cinerariifolium]